MSTGPAAELAIAEWVHTGASWRGTVPLAAFERFAAAVLSAGDVEVEVRLGDDEAARARVTGRCGVDAVLVCSRCADDAAVRIDCAVDFRLVGSEAEAEALTPMFDTMVASGERVSVAALVEDDLLLNLPEVGCADRETCPHWAEQQADVAAEPERRESPFAALGALKASGGTETKS